MTTLTKGQQQATDYLAMMGKRSAADYKAGSLQDMINGDRMIQDMQSSAEGVYNPSQMTKRVADLTALYNSQGAAGAAQSSYDDYNQNARDNLQFHMDHPSGNDSNWLDHFMEAAIPMVAAAFVGGGTMGLFGDGAGAAGAAGEGALGASVADGAGMGLGAQAIDTAALGNMGWMDGVAGGMSGGAATAGGAAAGLGASGGGGGGLGSMIGIEGGPMASVSVGAPTAGGGFSGLGGLGASVAGGLGMGLGAQGIDTGALQNMPDVQQGAGFDPIGAVTPGNMPTSALPYLAAGSVAQGTGSGTTGGLPSGLGNLGSAIGGLGGLVGANVDRIKNQQDQDYWQGLMDKMMGMYQPGTPEATLMEQQMNAKDATAGRNSQYGVRAVNLGAQLAGQRMQAMQSPSFYKMGEAARGHYDNSLNSLFSQFGNYTNGSSTSGGSGGNLGSLLGLGKSLFGGGESVPNVGSSASYANNDYLTS